MTDILIVDDEKSVCQFLEILLEKWGYNGVSLSNPHLLYSHLEKDHFDLILLDFQFPNTTGLELLKQLKTHSSYQTIPVIMLTSERNDQILAECLEQGAFDYSYKPVNEVVLKARIHSALKIKNAYYQKKQHAKSMLDALHQALELKTQEIANQFISITKSYSEELTLSQLEQIQMLGATPLFEGINPLDLKFFVQSLAFEEVDIGEKLLTQGQKVIKIYFIKKGIVDILVNGDRVAQRGVGDLLGEMSTISGSEIASATAVTVTPCQLWAISYDSFLEIINQIPALRSKMTMLIASRLNQLTRRFSEILKHIPHGIIQVNLQGIITDKFSTRCIEYLEITQLEGKSLGEILFAKQEEQLKEWNQTFHTLRFDQKSNLNQTINRLPSEVYYHHPDGTTHIFELFYYTILDENNGIVGVDIGFDDITDNKQSQLELSSFQSILTNLEQLFILFDIQTGIVIQETLTNSQLGRTHFPHLQQLKGEKFIDLLLSDQEPEQLDHINRWLHMLQDPFCLQTMPHEELSQLAPTLSLETAAGQAVELSFTISPNPSSSYMEALGYFQFIEEDTIPEDTNYSMMRLMEEVTTSESEFHHDLIDALNEMQSSIEVVQKHIESPHTFAKHQKGIARMLHSIKGLAQSFKLKEMTKLVHSVEETLTTVLQQGHSPEVYQQLEKILQSLMALVMVSKNLCDNQVHQDLGEVRTSSPEIRVSLNQFQKLKQKVEKLVHQIHTRPVHQNIIEITDSLKKDILLLELTKLSAIFPRLRHIVQDTSKLLRKKVRFDIHNAMEFYVSAEVAHVIHNCLIHLVKNAVYHGIETPRERLLLKKPEEGDIELHIEEREGKLHIIITDDGIGLNYKNILNRAVELKLITPVQVEQMVLNKDYDAISQFIFISGFSTASSTSVISGRGVGMDVIKTDLKKLGGHILLNSCEGKGTSISLILPPECNKIISEEDPHLAA